MNERFVMETSTGGPDIVITGCRQHLHRNFSVQVLIASADKLRPYRLQRFVRPDDNGQASVPHSAHAEVHRVSHHGVVPKWPETAARGTFSVPAGQP